MAWRIEHRRDTAADWVTKNPILLPGEIGVEIDTNKFKIGDGVQSWTTLHYFIDETGVGALIAQAVIDGVQGPAGESSYQLAVDGGFVGTQAEWLASLVGPKGDQGDPGTPGAPGSPGAPGTDGQSAYEIAMSDGFSGTESEWLASLVGPAGADGADYTGPTITVATTAPSGPAVGDVWIDTSS